MITLDEAEASLANAMGARDYAHRLLRIYKQMEKDQGPTIAEAWIVSKIQILYSQTYTGEPIAMGDGT